MERKRLLLIILAYLFIVLRVHAASPAPTPLVKVGIIEATRGAISGLGAYLKQVSGEVLGTSTKFIQKTASDSATTAKKTFYKATLGSLIKEVDKLNPGQKKELKEYLCK